MLPRFVIGMLAGLVALILGVPLFFIMFANFEGPGVFGIPFAVGLAGAGAVFWLAEKLHLAKPDQATPPDVLSLASAPHDTPIADGQPRFHQPNHPK